MSNMINTLYELKYNPFKYGPYFESFYNALGESENNILLSQLIIPLCNHPKLKNKIFNSNKKSTMETIFSFSNLTELYDLQEWIDQFLTLSRQCILYCLINDCLSFNDQHLSLYKPNNSKLFFENQKIAEKLGKLFQEYAVREIYRKLRVSPR